MIRLFIQKEINRESVYIVFIHRTMSSSSSLTVSRETTDSVVYSVVGKFLERSAFGFQKYGTNLDRTDLSVLEWIQHAQEEHMDAILYLEKLKQELSPKTSDQSTQTPEKLIETESSS